MWKTIIIDMCEIISQHYNYCYFNITTVTFNIGAVLLLKKFVANRLCVLHVIQANKVALGLKNVGDPWYSHMHCPRQKITTFIVLLFEQM